MEREDLIKTIVKKYGDGVICNGLSIIENKKQSIPFSPVIDSLLGSAIEEGSVVNLSGPPGAGKTTAALDFVTTCQKEEYGARDCYFFDIENRLKIRSMSSIKGFNPEKFSVVRSTEDVALTGQQFLMMIEDILTNNKRVVVIVDSLSMLCHEKEMSGGVEQSSRGASAYTILPGFFRRMAQVIAPRNNILININQLMKNPSGYGGPSEKGGEAIKYAGDYQLRITKTEPWKEGDKVVGQSITWKCIKTSGKGGVVGAELDGYLRYGVGIDKLKESLIIAEERGLILCKGAWCYMPFAESYPHLMYNEEPLFKAKFNGQAKMFAAIERHTEWQEALLKEIS